MRLRLIEYFTARTALLECGYCSRQFELSIPSMRARLKRWHVVKCPGCGATLEEPIDDRRPTTR